MFKDDLPVELVKVFSMVEKLKTEAVVESTMHLMTTVMGTRLFT